MKNAQAPGDRRFGRPGGWQQADVPDASDAADWFAGRLPDDWFTGPATVEVDREEIVVVGELPPVESGDSASEAAVDGRIARFRESTRADRMRIAHEAELRYGRKVAWGVTLDGRRSLFTHLAVPVMTRLRQPERKVLDTLVDAGVARSRSDALMWTVRLAGKHSEQWLTELREAMAKVDELRADGPQI
ncbi:MULTISPECIES: hypothetical protein [Rhodococcus]|jgi:hypothetical protein|uniref:Smu12A n=1 Tax=Rhodococcus oxybenzonivorans TaxID=1990687 RepID=A0A2S2C0S3_9NOCA|nr:MULTISPECIES: hypothetical protein [Rhodococcus]AWK74414.1 hypothetical protein CBI38_25520 [Rhodococcus oxybenzonivorans]MDV7246459.1 hypothetical protein [Rhodococcus oxybenzonivorans]MDV7265082.1 hypothetical protein [Rhodococcus oxybenzonivorans]MDV7277952.1 hypothetical protein [Rhodococcus oxybenzonivorans]MDV7337471.1 hypothetical protein [Rhodococcus oxybenzonivorans]